MVKHWWLNVVVGFYKLNVNEFINIVNILPKAQWITNHYAWLHHDADLLHWSAHHPWSLSRVLGRALDPRKHCYVATKRLCGVRLNAFRKNEIFRRFPDEIRSVPPADLKPVNRACSFPTRQPDNLYVVSTFGLSAALLRPTIVFELFLLFQVTTTKAFFTSIIK